MGRRGAARRATEVAGLDLDLLENAEPLRERLGVPPVVFDADVHHLSVIPQLTAYMAPGKWRRVLERGAFRGVRTYSPGDRGAGGRIQRPETPVFDRSTPPAAITALVNDMARLGADYALVFPEDLLTLGMYPDREFETVVASAYARWVTECVTPYEDRAKFLLYLPVGNPAAALRMVLEYGDAPGIVGCLVTAERPQMLHEEAYLPVYAAMEERGLTFGLHSGSAWWGHPLKLLDRFLTAHGLAHPMFIAVHLANLVMNGIPERFPGLRFVFFEAGAAIIPMLMARLDAAYFMSPSDAPLLRRPPSEYMKQFWYTVQPLEHPESLDQLQAIFNEIGTDRILYASDYPHWDFDTPAAFDWPFLKAQDRADIFLHNACRAFGLKAEELTPVEPARRRSERPARARLYHEKYSGRVLE
jgi:predicted TIM-barrel fold metal-dependent hydrolase